MNLSSGLPYSADVYANLLAGFNVSWWPVTLAGSLFGAWVVVLSLRAERLSPLMWRLLVFCLCALAGFVAIAYQYMLMAPLDFMGLPYALGWGICAVWIGVRWVFLAPESLHHGMRNMARDYRKYLGAGLMLMALLGYPLLQVASGMAVDATAYFGSSPDALALFVTGLAIRWVPAKRWDVLSVPVLWSIVNAFHAYLLSRPTDYIPLALMVAVMGSMILAGILKPANN